MSIESQKCSSFECRVVVEETTGNGESAVESEDCSAWSLSKDVGPGETESECRGGDFKSVEEKSVNEDWRSAYPEW
jgi:hypothetical protein